MTDNILKQRSDNKLSKDEILWGGLYNYGMYGPVNPYTNILSKDQLKALKADELITKDKIFELLSALHHVLWHTKPRQPCSPS